MAVSNAQRHTQRNPCPVCGGHANLRHGQSARCYGFTSDDGLYVRCTRVEYAGGLNPEPSGYLHFMNGGCYCGTEHSTGVITNKPLTPVPTGDSDTTKRGLAIWNESLPSGETVVETYLAGRGIHIPIPPSLRYHPCPEQSPYPAMVAAVADGAGNVGGIHMTFIAQDGRRKAPVDIPKKRLGSVPGGSVWLATPGPVLMLCEGIEDGLVLIQATSYPCWAVMGANNYASVALPPKPMATRVILAIDGDGVGRRGAHDVVQRFKDEGRDVLIAEPDAGRDWNQMLILGGHSDD